MGWDYGPETKAELVARLTKRAVASKLVSGKHLWMVYPSSAKADENVIILCLLQRHQGLTGYKDMSESMEPYYWDCPLAFLDMAPTASEKWREGVRSFHAQKAARAKHTWKPGDAVRVYGRPYTLVEKVDRSWLIRDAAGKLFKTGQANLQPSPHEAPDASFTGVSP